MHPKARRLARALEIPLAQAIGHLHCFWWWALDYCEDGGLNGYDALDIALGSEWDGDPEKFVKALRYARWIDEDDSIHDWDEYIGRIVEKRESNRRRARDAYARKKAESDSLRVECAQTTGFDAQSETLPTNQPTNQPTGARARELVTKAFLIDDWRKRKDDAEVFEKWLGVYSAEQIEKTMRELRVHQATNHKYKDLRRALGTWLARQEPECDTLSPVVGKCQKCEGELRQNAEGVTSCPTCGPGKWVSQCYGPSLWRPDD
jgi:hypothetical protein